MPEAAAVLAPARGRWLAGSAPIGNGTCAFSPEAGAYEPGARPAARAYAPDGCAIRRPPKIAAVRRCLRRVVPFVEKMSDALWLAPRLHAVALHAADAASAWQTPAGEQAAESSIAALLPRTLRHTRRLH